MSLVGHQTTVYFAHSVAYSFCCHSQQRTLSVSPALRDGVKATRTAETFSDHSCTPQKPFSNFSARLTTGWFPENFVMISLTVQELSCWQTNEHPRDIQTNTQTDIAANNTTLIARVVTNTLEQHLHVHYRTVFSVLQTNVGCRFGLSRKSVGRLILSIVQDYNTAQQLQQVNISAAETIRVTSPLVSLTYVCFSPHSNPGCSGWRISLAVTVLVGRYQQVTLRCTRLILGWVTLQTWIAYTNSVCNQPLGQLSLPSLWGT